MDSMVYSLKFYPLNVDSPNKDVMAGIELSSLDGNCDINLYHISDVFHCDGLLLLRTNRDTENMEHNRLVVWNPCSGKIRWIQPMINHCTNDIFALGYHSEFCDSYKVLRILDYRKKCEIYEFNSNSWRALLDDVTLGCILQSRGVSLKGNTYWIASQDKDKDFLRLSFDFTRERFGCLMNLSSQCLGYEVLALSVVGEEQLSILQQRRDTSKVEIWVTTNDEIDQTKALSWSKFLAVDLNTYIRRKFTCDVSFFIHDEEKKVVFCCDKGIAYIFGENSDFGKVYLRFINASLGPAVMSQAWFKINLEAIGNITIPEWSKPVWRKLVKNRT